MRRLRSYLKEVAGHCSNKSRGNKVIRFDELPVISPPVVHCLLDYLLSRSAISCSTTPGSAKVDVSPKPSISLAAILRRMRRMILPERVLGRLGAHWIISGLAIAPISRTHNATSSFFNSSLGSSPVIKVDR